jgi:hypothetical protein
MTNKLLQNGYELEILQSSYNYYLYIHDLLPQLKFSSISAITYYIIRPVCDIKW